MAPRFADAESEYAKDPKIRKEDVQILLDWIQKQPHLPKINEFKVILFLQSCYYRIEATKTTIENYYTVRAHCPEFFTNRTLSSIEYPMKLGVVYLLPTHSVNGYSVMFGKLVDPTVDQFQFNDALKYFDMTASLAFQEVGTSQGHLLVLDMQGTTFAHVAKVNIMTGKKYIYFLQEAMPVRVKGIHLVNVSPISQRLLSLVKPFLKKDILEMLHVHGSIEELYDYVPKESLPEEYGGRGGNIQKVMEQQKRDFEENKDFFLREEEEIADEAKRIGKPKNPSDIFGIDGTFKKLEID